MGHSSPRTGKLSTRGIFLMAKAPSLRKDRNKGTQRTRKLSAGNALRSWRNGKGRFVRARRRTAGAKPYTMKVVRTVFNGGHEETYGNATRLVPTQLDIASGATCLFSRGRLCHIMAMLLVIDAAPAYGVVKSPLCNIANERSVPDDEDSLVHRSGVPRLHALNRHQRCHRTGWGEG